MDKKLKVRILKLKKNDDETDKKLENIMDDDDSPKSIENASHHESKSAPDHFMSADIETEHDTERIHRHRKNRIIVVACSMVFTLLLAVTVGGGMALWDLEKTPADLFASMSGSSSENSSDSGLTFIDADSKTSSETDEASEEGLTFIDANEDNADTADAESEEIADESSSDGEEASNQSASESDESADSQDVSEDTDDSLKAGDTTDDGKLIVSSELSAVGSVLKAGSDQALSVTTLSQAEAADPNEGYPLPFTAVDESYFNDALFIGDSRFYGFCLWSGIPGTNYCATSFNILNYQTFKVVQTGNGKVPIFSAMPYNVFTKIYIKVGLNEMGTSESKFEEVYAEVIDKLRQMQPRAIIYIHAVLPVTAAKSASDSTHNNPNIIARNASLKQFAADHQCYYIDAGPVLSDENGCLKSEMTSDGIHLSSAYMGVWKQYLMEHAVVTE